MRIIPVVDVMGGQVVRAVGGRRDEYRPISSTWIHSSDPIGVACRLLDIAASDELYVADLDAIRFGSGLSSTVMELLRAVKCQIWLDMGVPRSDDLANLPVRNQIRVVVATESAEGPARLHEVRTQCRPEHWAVSIDLMNGRLMGNWQAWDIEHPGDVAGMAIQAAAHGAGTIIVLDLAAVGTRSGPTTLGHVRAIRAALPRVSILTGGGIRRWDDVVRLEDAGADGVLIASALHDGELTFPQPDL